MYDLYNTIQDLCNNRGITMRQLSDSLGLHRNTLPRLKQNPGRTLSWETIQKIALYFNVPTEFFVDLGEPSPRDIPPEPEISDSQLIFALWKDNPNNMTKDDLERVRSFAKYIEQEKGEKN